MYVHPPNRETARLCTNPNPAGFAYQIRVFEKSKSGTAVHCSGCTVHNL